MTDNDIFWGTDPNVIFKNLDFFPTSNMTNNEQLTAISRLVIVLSAIAFSITKNLNIVVAAVLTLGTIWVLAQSDVLHRKIDNKNEGFDNDDDNITGSGKGGGGAAQYQEATSQNPMSNVLLTDYVDNPQKLPAPPAFTGETSENILKKTKKMIDELHSDYPGFSDELFGNINDEFAFEQSMRAFTSNANTTIPDDQSAFANYLYGSMVSCKNGNQFACARSMPPRTIL